MSPSARSRGSAVCAAVNAWSVHASTRGSVIRLRHLPLVITTGTLSPEGIPNARNCPLGSEIVWATGLPGSGSLQRAHCAPSGNGPGSVPGTYTLMPYSGNVPLGANTVPDTEVSG